jgi:hypothetical protein
MRLRDLRSDMKSEAKALAAAADVAANERLEQHFHRRGGIGSPAFATQNSNSMAPDGLQEKPLSLAHNHAMPLLRQEAVMVSIDHYRDELVAQLGRAAKMGQIDILTNAAELYRSLAKSPQTAQEMERCCDAMQAEMKPGDSLIVERANGAGMTVRYLLPRSS